MSETPNIDELRELTRRLQDLLEDPHVGIPSWWEAYYEVLFEIDDFIPGRAVIVTEKRID